MYRLLLLFFVSRFINCSCPDGFELVINGQCRESQPCFTDYIAAWVVANTAVAQCNELGAQPVIIHNSEEYNYWQKKLVLPNSIPLGLLCNTTTKKWLWSDGSAIDFKPPYYDNDLNNNCNDQCSWYQNTQGWYNGCYNDGLHLEFYCTAQLQQPVLPVDSCYNFDDDNEDGVCYQIGTAAESWQEAQLICKQLGANLAAVHNTNENSFIRRLAVSQGAVHGVFLGATISGKGGSYGWIDGSEWDYQNFFPGFPKPGYGDCVALDTSTTAGQWMNMDCTAKLPVACIRDRKTFSAPNITCTSDPFKEKTVIASPGFPTDASVPCDYFLAVDDGKKVEVEITFLEANSCCDFLTIYDGYFGGYLLANLTGEVRNATYTTSASNFMRVSWQPNGGVNVMGMAMTFRGV